MNIRKVPLCPGSCELVLFPGEHTPVLVNSDACPTTLCVTKGTGWIFTKSKPAKKIDAATIILQPRNRPYVIWTGTGALYLTFSLIRTKAP